MEKEKQVYYEWKHKHYNKTEIEFGNIIEKESKSYVSGFTAMGFYGGYHSRDEEIATLKAEIDRKGEALRKICEQKKSGELEYSGDYEYGYDCIIDIARQALSEEE